MFTRKTLELLVVSLIFFCGCNAQTLTHVSSTGWKNMDSIHEELFLREYSSEHLQKNPHQTIQTILIQIDHFPLRAKKSKEDRMYIDTKVDDVDQSVALIYVKHKNGSNWYAQGASCKKPTSSDVYECYIDGDGGQFTLKLENNKQLVLTGQARLEKCGIEWEEVASTDNSATSSLNNDLGDMEVFWLNQVDKSVFSKILKNSQCI